MNLLRTLVLIPLIIPCLEYLNHLAETTDGPGGAEDIYYEEPDLSGGIEGVDYLIVYWNGETSEGNQAWNTLELVVTEQYELLSI